MTILCIEFNYYHLKSESVTQCIISRFILTLRYYYDNEDVKNDKELKDYLNELSAEGSILFGGRYGKVSIESSAFSLL